MDACARVNTTAIKCESSKFLMSLSYFHICRNASTATTITTTTTTAATSAAAAVTLNVLFILFSKLFSHYIGYISGYGRGDGNRIQD